MKLEWGGGEVDDFLLHEIVDYSEKAILNDGFDMDEWIEINTPFLVLSANINISFCWNFYEKYT